MTVEENRGAVALVEDDLRALKEYRLRHSNVQEILSGANPDCVEAPSSTRGA